MNKQHRLEVLRGKILLTRIMIRVMESDWPHEDKLESLHLLLDQEDFMNFQSNC